MKTILLSAFMLFSVALLAQRDAGKEILVLAQPNPVHEKLQLVVESPDPVSFTASVNDLTGMPVLNIPRTYSGKEGVTKSLDFRNLDSGIYICRIVFDHGEVRTIRLLKD